MRVKQEMVLASGNSLPRTHSLLRGKWKKQVAVVNDVPLFLIHVMPMHHFRPGNGDGLNPLGKSLSERSAKTKTRSLYFFRPLQPDPLFSIIYTTAGFAHMQVSSVLIFESA